VGIEAVELFRVRLPLVAPWRTATSLLHEREVLLVRVVVDGVVGWGECSAMPEPTYTEEWLDGAEVVLRRWIVEGCVGAGRPMPVGHRMARAALEGAVADAASRRDGVSLAEHLGGAAREVVEATATIGVHDDLGALLAEVDQRVAEGYGHLRLKITRGWHVEPVTAVLERLGDGVPLAVDANGSLDPADPDDLAALDALDRLGLTVIEQPFAADELLAHADLAARLRTPIGLDESITSVAVARTALHLGAADAVNVKAARLGGLREAVAVRDVCADAGVAVWCGGMLETGVGRAAALALASLPAFAPAADLSATARYYRHDVTEPFVLEDGCLRVPVGTGLGVEVLPDRLPAPSWRWTPRRAE
jgi:O-succinylbenzoate synthase